MILYPYGVLTTGGVLLSCAVGNIVSKGGDSKYAVSTTAGLVITGASFAAYTIMDAKYQNVLDKYSVETSTSYVQQLSDEELETALMQFGLLESDDKNDVKVL